MLVSFAIVANTLVPKSVLSMTRTFDVSEATILIGEVDFITNSWRDLRKNTSYDVVASDSHSRK